MQPQDEKQPAADRQSPSGQPTASPGRPSLGLDWLDLLILLALVYLTLLVVQWTGWRPRKTWVGLVLAPVYFAALGVRQQVWPSRKRYVSKSFTFGGFFASSFLVFGFLSGALGCYMLYDMSQEEPRMVTEADVDLAIQPRLTALRLQGLSNMEIREVTAEEAAAAPPEGVVTDVEELFAALELDKTPSEEELQRYRAEARQELEAQAVLDLAERNANGRRTVTWLGGIAVFLLLAGGFLDSRRAAHPAVA